MRRHSKAPSAGSNLRQAGDLGRIVRGAFAGREASLCIDGSSAPAARQDLALAAHVPALLTTLLAATLLALGFGAASAQAKKGWAFKEHFGSVNKPEFHRASGMAIDRSTDDLLVVDGEATPHTLTRWNADGTPANFSALGTNVIDGKRGPGAKPCAEEPASCDEIPSGEFLNFFSTVAVDNSGTATDGDIYVANSQQVDIFSANGNFLGRLTACGSESFSAVNGVGVDEDGTVYLGAGEKGIKKFVPTANPPVNANCTGLTTSLAVIPTVAAIGAGPSAGYLFVISNGFTGVKKINAATGSVEYGFGESLNFQPKVAVDPVTGHVFVSGREVAEYDASGPLAIELSRLEDAGGTSISGIAAGEGAEQLYVRPDFGSSHSFVDVYEAVTAPEAFVGPPSLVSGAKATATANVKPEGQAVTECFFEYGKTTSYGKTAPCEPGAAELPVDFASHKVSGHLTGLLANGTTYHYRLVVKTTAKVFSADETFVTANTYSTDPASSISKTAATLNGTVKLEGVALTACRFEYGTAFYSSSVPCTPAFGSIPSDEVDHPVSAAVGALEPSTTYRFRLVAENSLGTILGAEGTFTTRGTPLVEETPIDATQTTVTLQARINPAGSGTTYHFEWGPDTAYGNRIPADHDLFVGSGSEPVRVTASVSDLVPVSTYHFRVVATNSSGTTVGPDQPFETLNAAGLPNNRGIELVSPAAKGTSGSVSPGFTHQLGAQASEDGNSFLYPIQNGIPDSTVGGWTRWQAKRTSAGWVSAQVSAPALATPPEVAGFLTPPSIVVYASRNLGCAILETYNSLTADTPPLDTELGVENLYRWNSADGTYDLLTNRVPTNPEIFDPNYEAQTSDDCSRVFFRPTGANRYQFIAGASGLYEWDEGTLRDAGTLPNGASGAAAVLGGEAVADRTSQWNAVSAQGSLFFSAISNEGADNGTRAVFMREDGGAEVTDISQSQTAVNTNGARFETASKDGGKVFFVANYGIADNATSEGPTNAGCDVVSDDAAPPIEKKACDLYAYDTETGELTDISADPNSQDPIGAAVQGAVAVDQDGSHVYFAALGQLVPGEGRTYAQNITGEGSANVYLATGGQVSYVTTLGRGDLMNGALMRLGSWSAKAAAHRLLLESASNLTDYDSGGGKEAYLYDADTGRLSCLSCRPDGGPTLTLGSTRLLAPATIGERLSAVTEDGSRAFFQSPDVLAPGAQPGEVRADGILMKANVYQWQEGQVTFLTTVERSGGNGYGVYLDTSTSGNDVFIGTKGQLVPEDKDFVADVYDIRVDGGFPLAPEAPRCQVDESVPLVPNQIYCQGTPSPQPGSSSPASAGFQGSGNPPAGESGSPSGTCPKGKVRRHGRCVKRPARKHKAHKSKRAHRRAANNDRGGAR